MKVTQHDLDTIPLDDRLRETGFGPLGDDEPEPRGWLLLLAPAAALVSLIAVVVIASPHVAKMMGW